MLGSRLGLVWTALCQTNRPANLLLQGGVKNITVTKVIENKKSSQDEDDRPLTYSTSEAAQWKAKYAREPPRVIVWYTPHVVSISLSIFMIYFCILREENDIDELIYRPLTETIEGIEHLFPNTDLTQKPDYVLYHERRKLEKKEKREKQGN